MNITRTFVLLLAITISARAQEAQFGKSAAGGSSSFGSVVPASGGGGSCTTVQTNRLSDTTTGTAEIGRFVNATNATWFIASSSGTECEVDYKVGKVGSPVFNLNAVIMSDDGSAAPGKPNALLAASGDTINASSISTTDPTESIITFTFSGVAITSGTKYWVTLKPDNNDSANYVLLYCSGSFENNDTQFYSSGWGNLVGRTGKIQALSR